MNRLWPVLIAGSALIAANPQPVQSFRLPSGLQVRLLEDHERPLVRLEFRVTRQAAELPPGREGLAGILARLFDVSGADGLNREEFLRSLEDSALRYSFRSSPGGFTWSMVATSQNLDPAFHHLAMAVARPAFSEAALEQQRQILLQEIRNRSPRERAELLFLRSLGDPSSLATPQGALLTSVPFRELESLRRRILRPERAVLAIHGDLSLDQARQLAALHFGAWGPGLEPAPGSAPAAEKSEGRAWMVADSSASVEIRAGSPLLEGDVPPGMAQELAARLLQREFRGKGSGLGTLGLRGAAGAPRVIQAVSLPGARLEDALGGFQALLAQLRGRVWTDADLTWARGIWRAEENARALHPPQMTASLASGGTQVLDPRAASESTSPGEIQKIIRAWLEPSALHWLILGGRAEDKAMLEKSGLAPVTAVE